MEILKKIGIYLFVLGMIGVCFSMEYYTYQGQEVMWSVDNQKETETISNAIMENKERKEEAEQKIAYLTFDDGPSSVTERILDVLKVYNIRATFFLIGSNITEEREGIVTRMVEEGHAIGIHTYSHKAEKMYASAEAFLNDFNLTEQRIYEVTGLHTKLFRFPWGSANDYLKGIDSEVIPELESAGYVYVDWNVSAEDAVGTPTADSILQNVKKDYSRYHEPVILMHDSATSTLTAEMLPDIIVMLKDSGYQFSTLDKMDNPYQYPRD